MAVLGISSLLIAPSGQRIEYLMGHSALQCPWNVLALSVPALAATLWAVRGLAPTRPRLAGLAAGLFSGGIGGRCAGNPPRQAAQPGLKAAVPEAAARGQGSNR